MESENIYRESFNLREQGRLLFSPDVAMLPSKRMKTIRRGPGRTHYLNISHYDLRQLRAHTERDHPLTKTRNSMEDRRFARHRPDRPRRHDVARAQTSQIRELRDRLALQESDLPCLHLTFLDGSAPLHYKVRSTDNVYQTLKTIVEIVESSDLKTLKSDISDITRRTIYVREQIQRLQRKSLSIQEIFVSVIASLREEVARKNDGHEQVLILEAELLALTRDPSEERRRSAFGAFKGAREVLRVRSDWRDLRSGVQRTIDLVPKLQSFSDVSDAAAAFEGLNEQKVAEIARLNEQRIHLESQKDMLHRRMSDLVSPRSIRQRVSDVLSGDREAWLDTFVVIAARQEMDAARSYLDMVGANRESHSLSETWSAERIQLPNGQRSRFGLIQAPAQGLDDMTAVLDFLQSKAKPKAILLIGMMAGIPGKSRLLDVQAPRNIINGTRLGTRGGRIIAEPHGRDVDPVMHNRLQSMDQRRRGIGDIVLVTHKHSICVSAKFDDLTPELAQAALSNDPENIVGIEMEGSALTSKQAALRRSGEDTGYLMIKGVADYAGGKASGTEIIALQSALEASGLADAATLLEDPDPTTNKLLKSALQKIATIRALRVAIALIEEGQK